MRRETSHVAPEFIDLPVNWYEARDCFSNQPPSMSFLTKKGGPATTNELSVYVPTALNHSTSEIREFLQERECRYRLYGRFAIEYADFETRRELAGFNFVFEDAVESVYFKLRWGCVT